LFLLDLLTATEPRVVSAEYIFDPPGSDKEKLDNARYAISVARKLGATIFLLPEDITEVKPKMILTFIASIMSVSK
jgi:plastin-1